MFEKIHFLPFDFHFPIKNEFYTELLHSLDAKHAPEQLMENVEAAFHSQFYLSGESHFLPIRPVSEFAAKHLFYLQIFCMLYSKQDYYTERSDYDSYMLLYTYDGEGILEYEQKTYTLKAGDGFFIDCKKPHHYYTAKEYWHHSDLHINGSFIDTLYQEFEKTGAPVFFQPLSGFYQADLEQILLSYQNLSSYWELDVSHKLEGLLLKLIQDKCREDQKPAMPENMRYLIRYMESNYIRPLSLDDLSAFSGLSKYHLSREFKKYTGFSPNGYLIELRIRQAEILLKTTDFAAVKIGFLVGFTSENNFVTLFKKKNGCTPAKYRKEHIITD